MACGLNSTDEWRFTFLNCCKLFPFVNQKSLIDCCCLPVSHMHLNDVRLSFASLNVFGNIASLNVEEVKELHNF